MKCYCCNANLIWGGDHSYEDYGIEEEDGIVTNLSCSECESEVIVYQPIEIYKSKELKAK
jgi:hypothetical protein